MLCIFLVFTMLTGALTAPAFAEADAVDRQNTFIKKMNDAFIEPELDYHPEARWWLAEGSHTDETLLESIRELYDDGFGAVEFVTLDESAYLDDSMYAWGSEEWVHDSHLIMEECTRLGMGVSFTSGTHWSTANLTVITPDDQAASQELGYRTVDVAAGQTFEGELPVVELPEDVTRLRFVKLIAARRADAESNELVLDSLADISDKVEESGENKWTVAYSAPDDGDYMLFAFYQYRQVHLFRMRLCLRPRRARRRGL